MVINGKNVTLTRPDGSSEGTYFVKNSLFYYKYDAEGRELTDVMQFKTEDDSILLLFQDEWEKWDKTE